jgi:hypothetical protein
MQNTTQPQSNSKKKIRTALEISVGFLLIGLGVAVTLFGFGIISIPAILLTAFLAKLCFGAGAGSIVLGIASAAYGFFALHKDGKPHAEDSTGKPKIETVAQISQQLDLNLNLGQNFAPTVEPTVQQESRPPINWKAVIVAMSIAIVGIFLILTSFGVLAPIGITLATFGLVGVIATVTTASLGLVTGLAGGLYAIFEVSLGRIHGAAIKIEPNAGPEYLPIEIKGEEPIMRGSEIKENPPGKESTRSENPKHNI